MELIEEFFAFELYSSPNRLKGLTSSRTQRRTFQIINLLSLKKEIRIPRHWQDMYVLLTSLTKASLFHIKSYYDDILDLYILGPNMYNC